MSLITFTLKTFGFCVIILQSSIIYWSRVVRSTQLKSGGSDMYQNKTKEMKTRRSVNSWFVV